MLTCGSGADAIRRTDSGQNSLARPPSSIELSASEMAKGVAVPAAAVAQRRSARERGVAPCAAVLVRDRIFGQDFVKHVRAMGIKQVVSAPHSPWQRAYVERVIGTIRRQCLDHLIVFQERSLYRHLRTFVGYYHRNPCSLGIGERYSGVPTDPAAGVWPDCLDTGAGEAASPIRAERRLSNLNIDGT